MKSIMGWESATLVANGKFKYQDQDVTVKELWQLSDDGKTLIQSAHYTSPMGEMDTKMVYAKATP
jgi:exo-beta-1,3-glucanase (GH17 family)